MGIAVIVPVRARTDDDEGRLAGCLDALAAQTHPPDEVVVVDDASPRDLSPLVRGRTGVRLLTVRAGADPHGGCGSYAARNAGLAETAAAVVAFTDADCLPRPDWLECALTALAGEPDLAAVAGAIEVPVTPRCGAVAWYDALTAFPQRRFVERHGFGATANLVVRRAVFDAVGSFDATMRSGGDAEWGARATAGGHRIGYRDDVRVRHPPRRSARAVARKALRVTRGVEQLAAARGDADPLPRTLADRLGRPLRELPEILADRRVGPLRAAQVFGVAVVHAALVAAETARLRVDPARAAVVATGVLSAALALRGRGSSDAFGDGAAYRRMAAGLPGAPPFQRRIVGPALARFLGGDERAFRRVALAGVAAGSLTTGMLTSRVARESGTPPDRARSAGLLAAALVPTMPHSVRMAVQMPPFNDQLAVAAGGAWLLLDRAQSTLAPAALLLAGLVREQWLGVAAVAGRRSPAAAAATAVAATVIATRPAAAGGEVYPPRVALRRFVTADGLRELAWAAGTLVPFPALLGAPAGPTARALRRVVEAQTVLGLVGGSDSPRLLHGALPFLVAAAVGSAPDERRLAPVVAGALALWRPFTRPQPSAQGYERFHLPYMHGELGRRALGALIRLTGAAAATTVVQRWAAPGRYRRLGPTRSAATPAPAATSRRPMRCPCRSGR
jgi:GT2 family glycosyltransferase